MYTPVTYGTLSRTGHFTFLLGMYVIQRAIRKGQVFQYKLSTRTNMETKHEFPWVITALKLGTSCVSRMGQFRRTESVFVISNLKILKCLSFYWNQYWFEESISGQHLWKHNIDEIFEVWHHMGLFEGTVTYGTQIYDHQYFASQLHNKPSVCKENLLFQKLKSNFTSDP